VFCFDGILKTSISCDHFHGSYGSRVAAEIFKSFYEETALRNRANKLGDFGKTMWFRRQYLIKEERSSVIRDLSF